MRSPAMSASYSALLLVVSNSNLNAYVYSFPSGFTNISPAPEPSELEAPSVNSFHVFYGSGSFLFASPFFSSSLSVGDVSTRKSASICPLIDVRLTKYTGAYFFPLPAINTALTFLFEAARYIVKVSPLVGITIVGSD
ncbi:hypothetical protein Tco_0409346 [Tanacetum coccineum]